jgi:4-hydroxy-2-oxoheptanedioate aldolase
VSEHTALSAAEQVADPRPLRPQVGTVLTLPGAVSAELIAEPFDVVWIDLEHGALGRSEAQDMILGAQAARALALARVGLATADALIGPMLDAGADGIVVADVTKQTQVEWASRLMRYPPQGQRGYGPRRSALRGRITRIHPSAPPRLWVQVESQAGVAEAAVVGIADLCTDLGIPIGLSDARLHDAVRAVRDDVTARGVLFGVAGPLHPSEHLDEVLDGSSIRVHSTDARLCAASADEAARALKMPTTRRPPQEGGWTTD